jgi:hypothetical protein
MVLVNSYLIALYSDTGRERLINLKNQDDFRLQLVDSLLVLGKQASNAKIPRKRLFAYMNGEWRGNQSTYVSARVCQDAYQERLHSLQRREVYGQVV